MARMALLGLLATVLMTAAAFVPTAAAGMPPEVVITYPDMGATVSGVVTVLGEAGDSDGEILWVKVKIDLGEFQDATDTSGNGSWATWSYVWDTTTVADGWHKITAWTADNTFLHGDDYVEVLVDNVVETENHPPWVEIHYPKHGQVVCGEFKAYGPAGDPDEGDAVELVQVRFREGAWQDATPSGPAENPWSTWYFWFDTRGYDNGWGRLDARSWDGQAYSEIFDVWINVHNPCEAEENHRPWVKITNPAHGQTVSGIVVITGLAGDPDAGDKVELVVVKIGADAWSNAVPLGPADDPWRSWAKEWDTRHRDDGWVSICAKSWDGSLWSEPHCIEVHVKNGEGEHENHRPFVHITHPVHGQTVWGLIAIKGTAEDPDEPWDHVELVQVRIDNGEWRNAQDTSGDGTWHSWKILWNTKEWHNGWHKICARSFDGQLYSELDCIEVFVDNDEVAENHPPKVDITHPADGSTVSGLVEICGTAWDDHQVKYVEWKVDGESFWRDAWDTSGDGSWSTWCGKWDTTKYEDGCYTILARAYDGSKYSEIDHIVLCVDNHPDQPIDEPPTVQITHPDCGSEVSGIVTIQGTASDDNGVLVVKVKIDDGAWNDATDTSGDGSWSTWSYTWDTTEYTNGWHTIYAKALDNMEQWSEADVCEVHVYNAPDGGQGAPGGPGIASAAPPAGFMGLAGFLGAALVRRAWLGSVL